MNNVVVGITIIKYPRYLSIYKKKIMRNKTNIMKVILNNKGACSSK